MTVEGKSTRVRQLKYVLTKYVIKVTSRYEREQRVPCNAVDWEFRVMLV